MRQLDAPTAMVTPRCYRWRSSKQLRVLAYCRRQTVETTLHCDANSIDRLGASYIQMI